MSLGEAYVIKDKGMLYLTIIKKDYACTAVRFTNLALNGQPPMLVRFCYFQT